MSLPTLNLMKCVRSQFLFLQTKVVTDASDEILAWDRGLSQFLFLQTKVVTCLGSEIYGSYMIVAIPIPSNEGRNDVREERRQQFSAVAIPIPSNEGRNTPLSVPLRWRSSGRNSYSFKRRS